MHERPCEANSSRWKGGCAWRLDGLHRRPRRALASMGPLHPLRNASQAVVAQGRHPHPPFHLDELHKWPCTNGRVMANSSRWKGGCAWRLDGLHRRPRRALASMGPLHPLRNASQDVVAQGRHPHPPFHLDELHKWPCTNGRVRPTHPDGRVAVPGGWVGSTADPGVRWRPWDPYTPYGTLARPSWPRGATHTHPSIWMSCTSGRARTAV